MTKTSYNSVLVAFALTLWACASSASQGQAGAPVFVIGVIQPSGALTFRPSLVWNGSTDEDTVFVTGAQSGACSGDRVRLYVRSGPIRDVGEFPDPNYADSMGQWHIVPDSLLARISTASSHPPDAAAAFLPTALAKFTRREFKATPYLTRVAVQVCGDRRSGRAELRIQLPI